MPLFSVIIPTFNRAKLLKQAIDSVFRQTFKDYEVIVVDDGSRDGTSDYLAQLGKKITALVQQHKGPGAARNLGVKQAKGDYVAFLDSDDLWFPWTLQSYNRGVEEFGMPAVLVGASIPIEERSRRNLPGSEDFDYRVYPTFLDAWEVGHGFRGTPGMCVKLSVLREVGGFLAAAVNGEDQDLCLRLGASKTAVAILAPPVFRHRRHPGRISRNNQKSVAGINLLLDREQAGLYPGGTAFRPFRRRILCAAARSISLDCTEAGLVASAWNLYRRTLCWQIRLGRVKYALGLPLILSRQLLQRAVRHNRDSNLHCAVPAAEHSGDMPLRNATSCMVKLNSIRRIPMRVFRCSPISALPTIYDRLLNSRVGQKLPFRGKVARVRMRGHKVPFYLRVGTTDWLVLDELYILGDYDRLRQINLGQVRRVMDLGANVGYSARLWDELFPAAEVLAIEPDGENLRLCNLNCEQMRPRFQALQAFAGSSPGFATLDRTKGEWGIRKTALHGSGPTVRVMSIPQIMNDVGWSSVDLLKCDIEGSEWEVFAECKSWIEKVRYLLIELHGPSSLEHFRNLLKHSGVDLKISVWQSEENHALLFLSRAAYA
jgi:FkbM family methyltransferase